MSDIIEASQLPEGDKVYLKKDFIGWRVIEPWKDPITNEVNWFNLLTGGKRNMAILAFLFLLGGILYLGTQEMRTNYIKVVQDPCGYCSDCHDQTRAVIQGLNKDQFKPQQLNISFTPVT